MDKNSFYLKTVLALLFFLPVICYSQGEGIFFGVKGGPSYNSFGGQGTGIVTQKTGFLGGAYLNLSFLEFFSIQPEVLFHQGGATNTVNNNVDVLKLNYAEVPVLFKLKLPIAGLVFPHVFAGPDFVYRIGATYTATDASGKVITVNNGNIQKSGFGGVAGAGIDIHLEHYFLTLDGRYVANFPNLGSSTYNLNIYNQYFAIMAGIGVRL